MSVLSVVGARPQFVKAAAVSRALRTAGLPETMLHTGQHYDADMSQVFFDELDIPAPRHNLGVHGGRHGEMTGRMLLALEPILLAEKPDWVLVYGDTNSTLAAALAAAKLNLRVAHVEAGLRSFNRRMPEELNRLLTDHLSALLFCPTRAAVANLAREGIKAGVHHVGDVMYDATLHAKAAAGRRSDILLRLGLVPGRYDVATLHRAENTDDAQRLKRLTDWLKERAAVRPVVLPLHPRTRAAVTAAGLDLAGLAVIPPASYLDMAALVADAAAVYTDSGGLQKEAYFHRKPCVTLREETEWVETVAAGWNRLWQGPGFAPRSEISDYGDGQAAQRIVAILAGG
ncbi:MAG: UDP-N-acetylglucosamine 2-epimerase (non-hydrolyzing) [Alphaproteobacteria bacterium]|nr:UDP-N-acetylglucosamine 2-epimerase (non-hydrolyzing) [Alphaproteobacteria bacterium]